MISLEIKRLYIEMMLLHYYGEMTWYYMVVHHICTSIPISSLDSLILESPRFTRLFYVQPENSKLVHVLSVFLFISTEPFPLIYARGNLSRSTQYTSKNKATRHPPHQTLLMQGKTFGSNMPYKPWLTLSILYYIFTDGIFQWKMDYSSCSTREKYYWT